MVVLLVVERVEIYDLLACTGIMYCPAFQKILNSQILYFNPFCRGWCNTFQVRKFAEYILVMCLGWSLQIEYRYLCENNNLRTENSQEKLLWFIKSCMEEIVKQQKQSNDWVHHWSTVSCFSLATYKQKPHYTMLLAPESKHTFFRFQSV